MTTFQQIALSLIALWLLIVVVRFRRSGIALLLGMSVLGAYTLASLLYRTVTLSDIGLAVPSSWFSTLGFALAGLVVLLAYSPIADRLASHWFEKPPTLDAFGTIQQSIGKLIIGILVAWFLGGFLEELIARGIALNSIKSGLSPWLGMPIAASIATFVAAVGAGLLHSYQGPRAVLIMTQLSFLFGLLFVLSGYNLWTVVLCHGLYDTIAFIRFALKKSRYSNPERSSGNL